MTNTEEIIDRYCRQKFPDDKKYTRYFRAIARPELFAAEEENGKDFFHFNMDELENFLSNMKLSTKLVGTGKKISQSNTRAIIGWYRELFDFYMEETGIYFKNPLRDQRFKSLPGNVKDDLPVFTKTTLDRLCAVCESVFSDGECQMMQAVLLLHYCGCFDANEIIRLQENDVDIDGKFAVIDNRKISLTDECVEALSENHRIDSYDNYTMRNYMIPYHDSYMRFPYRAKSMSTFEEEYAYAYQMQQERPADQVRHVISLRMSKLRKETGVTFQADTIYYRGIYDYLISQCGEDRTKELIQISKSSKLGAYDTDELQKHLSNYGARLVSKTELYRIKNAMKQFIE